MSFLGAKNPARQCSSGSASRAGTLAVALALLLSALPAQAGSQARLELLATPAAAVAGQTTEPPSAETEPSAGEPDPAPPPIAPGETVATEPSPGSPEGEEVVETEAGRETRQENAEPPTSGVMEPSFPGEPAEGRVVISASPGKVFWDEEGNLRAEGKVLIKSVQYALEGDEATLDRNREWATLAGNVRLQGESVESRGNSVRVNLKTGEWHLAEGATVILPSFFTGGQVVDKLYLDTAQASSPGEGEAIDLRNSRLTSCDLERPHYFFSSDRVEVRPGDQIIAHRPSLHLFGQRVFRLPFKLVLFLDEERNRYLPEVGHNVVEGYYAKFAYPYLVGALGQGLLRLNLTTERGAGLGFDQQIVSSSHVGLASVMYEPSEGSLTSRLSDRFELGHAWVSDLNASYQTHSGFFGNTTSLEGNLVFNRYTSQGDMQIGYQNSLSESGFGTSRRNATTFSTRQRLDKASTMFLRGTWENSDYGGSALARESVDTNFQFTHAAGAFDLDLIASHLFQPSPRPGSSSVYALNRLPELTMRTDSHRLGNYRLLGKVPLRSSLILGQYDQQPADIQAFRAAWDTTLGGTTERWDSRTEATTSARFLQSVFSDSSAQYILAGDFDLRRNLGHDWQTRLHYTHSETHGYEPITLSYGTRASALRWDMVQATTDRTRLEISTGYDFVGDFWQDLRIAGQWMPNRQSKLTLQTGCGLQDGRWRPLGLIWTHVDRPRYYFTLAGEYDPHMVGLTRLSTEFDWRLSHLWQLSMVSSYSGYSRQIDAFDVQLQRDLHCMVGTVSYNLALDEFRFSLGIKAFPNPEQALGVLRSGAMFQALPGQFF
ncbi:MAG: hypothetical protein GX100_00970 [candidate division WS1 bacterium]|nr:hypothetical protein [candidate division WS1 bacterium]